MNHDIVVAAEQRDGIVQKNSFELIHGAAEVAGQTGGRVITVIAGFEIKEAAEQLSAAGSDEVWIIDQPSLKEYLPKPYTEAFLQAVKRIEPEIVLIGSTMIGMELAPQLAAGLDTGLVTDCTALTISSGTGLLLMTRPNTDGISIDTFICGERRPQIATVRPGVLAETGARDKADSRKSAEKVSQPAACPRGTVRHFTADLSGTDNGVRLLSTTRGGYNQPISPRPAFSSQEAGAWAARKDLIRSEHWPPFWADRSPVREPAWRPAGSMHLLRWGRPEKRSGPNSIWPAASRAPFST